MDQSVASLKQLQPGRPSPTAFISARKPWPEAIRKKNRLHRRLHPRRRDCERCPTSPASIRHRFQNRCKMRKEPRETPTPPDRSPPMRATPLPRTPRSEETCRKTRMPFPATPKAKGWSRKERGSNMRPKRISTSSGAHPCKSLPLGKSVSLPASSACRKIGRKNPRSGSSPGRKARQAAPSDWRS